MAKKSVKNRNANRISQVSRLRSKRDQLREMVSNVNASENERWEAMLALQLLPRNSNPVRRRNRCKVCDRPRGYNRLTGYCRLHLRIAVMKGDVPGMMKSSW